MLRPLSDEPFYSEGFYSTSPNPIYPVVPDYEWCSIEEEDHAWLMFEWTKLQCHLGRIAYAQGLCTENEYKRALAEAIKWRTHLNHILQDFD